MTPAPSRQRFNQHATMTTQATVVAFEAKGMEIGKVGEVGGL